MAKKWIGMAMVGALLASGMALAQRERLPSECRKEIADLCRGAEGGLRVCLRTALPELSDHCRKAISDRAMDREKAAPNAREIVYGSDPKQKMDIAGVNGTANAPILFYVHGGGWSIGDKVAGGASKGPWANGLGWAYASANYRLVPQATVEQQAADLANALAWLRANAAGQGLDPNRIVLMGHSAGAHLVALLGSDTSYLKAAGVPLSAIKGVILLDGAGYDIPTQGSAETNIVKPMYDEAFGTDPVRQAKLSPTRQAAAPNAENWLILPIERRADSQAQSRGLASALMTAGAQANVFLVPKESHASLNKGLGEKGDFATEKVETFLESARR
ncbi:MAG: alpha/beta hydrolase [Sphingomicrobium sp.]